MTFGQKASLYWALGAGRFWQTAGLFLMGLYIGRKQLFVTSEKHTRFWVKALIISAISFAPLFQLKELIMASDSVNPEKPDVPLNKNDAFQKVQKRRVQEKR